MHHRKHKPRAAHIHPGKLDKLRDALHHRMIVHIIHLDLEAAVHPDEGVQEVSELNQF